MALIYNVLGFFSYFFFFFYFSEHTQKIDFSKFRRLISVRIEIKGGEIVMKYMIYTGNIVILICLK